MSFRSFIINLFFINEKKNLNELPLNIVFKFVRLTRETIPLLYLAHMGHAVAVIVT